MRIVSKRGQLLPTNRQKHMMKLLGRNPGRLSHRLHQNPLISRLRHPRRPVQRYQRHPGGIRGLRRGIRNPLRKRVGSINNHINLTTHEPPGQTGRPTKTTNPHLPHRQARRRNPTSKRTGDIPPGIDKQPGQLSALTSATQN